MNPKLTSIRIQGMRTLEDVTLELGGLTVLIGENGTGKSTIVEAFELMWRVHGREFAKEFRTIHGGYRAILRVGNPELEISIGFGCGEIAGEFLVRLGEGGSGQFEELTGRHPKLLDDDYQALIKALDDALHSIDVQLPFDTTSCWSSRSRSGAISPMRDSIALAPSEQLERYGANLANVYHDLKNEHFSKWDETMDLVRLGLGDWVESVNTRTDAAGGRIALWIKPRCLDKQIPASGLSDGQLAYLAFVAMAQLPTQRSVLVFDEIDLHLHPRLLARVISLMERIAEHTPVVLTTHSRRVLDMLSDPAKSVRVLELDSETLSTRIRKLDPTALDEWLKDYDGLGHILDAGYPESMFLESKTEAGKTK